jgi:hypothetical protein
MHWPFFAALIASVATLFGCAELACTPATIEVASKDTRTRMVDEFRGVTNDETGRVTAIRREKLVPEYWVADRQGTSYRVTEEQWRNAQPSQPLAICR